MKTLIRYFTHCRMLIAIGLMSIFSMHISSPLIAQAKPAKSGYALVNGLKMYYEIYGKGKPLILLHGGLGEIEMFGPNIAALAKGREVIAVDLQGHGRTADIDRPISVELMADDIAALIKFLKLGSVDIMGYSRVVALRYGQL